MNRQVSWLWRHRPLVSFPVCDQWNRTKRTLPLQWRDRAGFAPDFPIKQIHRQMNVHLFIHNI